MSGAVRAQPQLTFDEFNRLRILDAEHAKHTESLAEDSKLFVDKVAEFNGSVEALMAVFSAQADKLEAEKLKAIGQRNVLESEAENRRRRQHELQYLIAQKQLEIQRCQEYFDSLVRAEQEQKATMDKLART